MNQYLQIVKDIKRKYLRKQNSYLNSTNFTEPNCIIIS